MKSKWCNTHSLPGWQKWCLQGCCLLCPHPWIPSEWPLMSSMNDLSKNADPITSLFHFPVSLWVKEISPAWYESPVISLSGHFQDLWTASMPNNGPTVSHHCLYCCLTCSSTCVWELQNFLPLDFWPPPVPSHCSLCCEHESWHFYGLASDSSLWQFLREGSWLHLLFVSLLTCVRHWLDKKIDGRQDGGMDGSGADKLIHLTFLCLSTLLGAAFPSYRWKVPQNCHIGKWCPGENKHQLSCFLGQRNLWHIRCCHGSKQKCSL